MFAHLKLFHRFQSILLRCTEAILFYSHIHCTYILFKSYKCNAWCHILESWIFFQFYYNNYFTHLYPISKSHVWLNVFQKFSIFNCLEKCMLFMYKESVLMFMPNNSIIYMHFHIVYCTLYCTFIILMHLWLSCSTTYMKMKITLFKAFV